MNKKNGEVGTTRIKGQGLSVIARETGGHETKIVVGLRDDKTNTFIDIAFTPQAFGYAVTGRASKCTYEILTPCKSEKGGTQ